MPIRISGMATGLDTDALVKQLMQAKRIPVDKMVQRQTQLEWKRDQYREVNTMFSQFREMMVNMKLQSTMGAKKASSSSDAIATATANASAMNGNHTFNITQLATSAAVTSDSLGLANNRTQVLTASALQLKVGGERGERVVDIPANATIDDVLSKINSQSTATGVTAQYDAASDRLFFNSTATGAQAFISVAAVDSASENFLRNTLKMNASVAGTNQMMTGTIKFEGLNQVISPSLNSPATVTVTQGATTATLTLSGTTTVKDLQDQITKAGLNMTLTLDPNGKIQFNSTAAFTLTDGANTGLARLGFSGASVNSGPVTSVLTKGKDALVNYNGLTGVAFHSNNFTVNNINISAKQTGTVTLNVNTDTDALVKTVKDFVTKYNEVIEKLNGKVSERTYRDFQPLTEEQKSAMSEDDIKRWEEKAKSGMLRNDSFINSALSQMRVDLAGPVSSIASPINSLAAIGITSGQWYENGKLTLNEAKLRDVLSTNPTEVMNLFTNTGEGSAQGVSGRLYDTLVKTMKNITDRAGSAATLTDLSVLGKQITDYDKRIDEANVRMARYEDQYYLQFSRLETAMARAQSQSQWLSQQLGSMSGGQ